MQCYLTNDTVNILQDQGIVICTHAVRFARKPPQRVPQNAT
jgi:hypothetical protein